MVVRNIGFPKSIELKPANLRVEFGFCGEEILVLLY